MSTARQEHLSNDIEFFPIPISKILLKFATELIVKIAKALIGSHDDAKRVKKGQKIFQIF